MDERRQTPLMEREGALPQDDPEPADPTPPGRPGWLTRHLNQGQRNAAFMLAVLLVGALTVLGLQQWGDALQATPSSPPATTQRQTTPAAKPGNRDNSPQVRPAHAKVYFLPDQQPGLMYPVLDGQGNLWVGEMSDNALARLDTQTGAVAHWTPPHGENNIMMAVVDKQGRIWFTEQAANYIGRFDPATHTFATYQIGRASCRERV